MNEMKWKGQQSFLQIIHRKFSIHWANSFDFIPGYLLFKDFCENVVEEPIPQIKFYEEVT